MIQTCIHVDILVEEFLIEHSVVCRFYSLAIFVHGKCVDDAMDVGSQDTVNANVIFLGYLPVKTL